MKKLSFILLMVFFAGITFAQEEAEKKQTVKFSGHIRYEAFYDTYASIFTREGDIYLYPKQANVKNNVDQNAYSQLNMLTAQSRLRAKINGPEAFGAKLLGLAEIDFLGTAEAYRQMPRIRHMMMQLNWEKTSLVIGQHWHPLFVTECFPQVAGMGAALPLNPLNRAPQIKLNYALSENLFVEAAMLGHLDMASSGVAAAQKQAVIPDFHGSIKFKTANIAAGIVGGMKFLKPRTHLTDSIAISTMASSWDVAGFAKISAGDLTFKLYGIYGQNLSAYTMIGGYGSSTTLNAASNDYVADYEYSNIVGTSVWTELMYKAGAYGFGIFGGYSANLGSSTDNYYSLGYARGENIKNLIRVSPRVTYTVGKLSFAIEHMLTSATYMTLAADKYEPQKDAQGKEMVDDPVSNNRFYFSATYKF